MRKILIGLICLGLSVSAFAGGKTKDPFKIKDFKLPSKYETVLKDYLNWPRLTGYEHSGLHWGLFIVVFTNTAQDIYQHNYMEYTRMMDEDLDPDDEELSFKTFPQGSVLVKENYSSVAGKPEAPLSVTVMIKREAGYDEKGGNWQYLQFDPTGSVIVDGSSQDPAINALCANCHNSISHRDHIFSTFYSHGRD